MRTSKYYCVILTLQLGGIIMLTGCFTPKATVTPKTVECKECYSLDKLPESWKLKTTTLRYLDDILPNTVGVLKDSRSCIRCIAPYSIGISFDSVEIISRSFESLAAGDRNQFDYSAQLDFRFKSFLTVNDSTGTLVARVQIVDLQEDAFSTKSGFSTSWRSIETTTPDSPTRTYEKIETSSPSDYLRNMVPGEGLLTLQTESKLKKISDRVKKFIAQ